MADTQPELFDALTAEFDSLEGPFPEARDVARLATALAAQEIEWGEIAITAACVGFHAGRGTL